MFNYYQSRGFCIWPNLIYSLSGSRCCLFKTFSLFLSFRFFCGAFARILIRVNNINFVPFNYFSSFEPKTMARSNSISHFPPLKLFVNLKKKMYLFKNNIFSMAMAAILSEFVSISSSVIGFFFHNKNCFHIFKIIYPGVSRTLKVTSEYLELC